MSSEVYQGIRVFNLLFDTTPIDDPCMWYCRFKRFLTPLQSCTEEGSMNPQLRLSLNPFISSTPPPFPVFSFVLSLSFNHLVNKLLLTIKPDTYLTTFSVEKMRNGRNGLILSLLQLQHPFYVFLFPSVKNKKKLILNAKHTFISDILYQLVVLSKNAK